MKCLFYFICFGLFISNSEQGKSQVIIYNKYELNIYYNWEFIGNVIVVDIAKNYKKNSLVVGAMFYTNQQPKDMGYFAYKDKAYANTFQQRFALNLGYRYCGNKEQVKPFFFYNFQLSSLHFRKIWITQYDLSDKFIVFDCLGGIGLKIKFTKQLYFTQAIGIGYSFFQNIEHPLPYKLGGFDGEYAKTYRIGLSYQFGRINNSKNQ